MNRKIRRLMQAAARETGLSEREIRELWATDAQPVAEAQKPSPVNPLIRPLCQARHEL